MRTTGDARRVRIRGIVQGVGFRPYVSRLARQHLLTGWVINVGDAVEIQIQGDEPEVNGFLSELTRTPPPAASIASVDVDAVSFEPASGFEIRASRASSTPTARVSPDLPVCDACLRELFEPGGRRAGYPYINCTDCGPRYSIVHRLPYDRCHTTMAEWSLCSACHDEYHDTGDRRFHAQPIACPECGPRYLMRPGISSSASELCVTSDPIGDAARLLREGRIVAVKGLGGYHLACDATNVAAVASLRQRKYRKEQAFALMVATIAVARETCELNREAEALLNSVPRPIVVAPRRVDLPGVAPDNGDLGLMLPYAPVHHLLFARGAPSRLVMTSGNRSSEPIAFQDDDAFERLGGLADVLLVGERPIARRIDDSIITLSPLGPVVIRRSRGLAPGAVASIPYPHPLIAAGGDLKNAITLVVEGQAYVSQHIGDLEHHQARIAFREAAESLMATFGLTWDDVTLVHDQHPQYISTLQAKEWPAARRLAVQHHRAHVGSVLAERGASEERVVGVSLDGTGYGDDGTIWGGEIFVGSLSEGFTRVASLAPALLPGGDAAARCPVQAAAGFIARLNLPQDLTAPPFSFPQRYRFAHRLVQRRARTFSTTSAGRLFDAVAAVLGFTRPITFEGQAAMWLEHLARQSDTGTAYLFEVRDREIDWRPALAAIIAERGAGGQPPPIARAFHRGLARALAQIADEVAGKISGVDTVVASGGVLQNHVLLSDLLDAMTARRLRLWINHVVPPNDGGLSLGQASLAAHERCSVA